ncbi:hypothetical protein GUITHDRAFT_87414 [Guillardia theta CCMP2712]|uniref:Uncharacterized protein n=1 Tax=Guillardia theta (strain CCMP2712) TaxID=905079 RepID=L1J8Q9_GUITC|nr:hypothetical protein GUITHDRAFT_87414 [Guillardia theta CCMP2712]EKX44489.1 hypothetical protein GUITHDRAFT_87414 [Guillardia theta CCMP2712]|eukprot:XP_005831469.1 hypothetical protein GUITHDRAFT_87414 [Guillardia theta CCMP2712]
MEDLRAHPLFQELPDPSEVAVNGPQDFHRFRQDSLQWALLHNGRLTTSRMASILGFYEPWASKLLNIPRSLSGHHKVLDAWQHLIATPCTLQDLVKSTYVMQQERMEEQPAKSFQSKGAARRHRGKQRSKLQTETARSFSPSSADDVWTSSSTATFPYDYAPLPRNVQRSTFHVQTVGQARMIWGSTQEATSILAAVNFFGSLGGVVHEIGLCPLETQPLDNVACLKSRQVSWGQTIPLMGASPDAIVTFPDGTIEAIEVKNHAPFRTGGKPGAFSISDVEPYLEIAPWHIPQLQLEMLCLGPQCRAVNFMSCTALKGLLF